MADRMFRPGPQSLETDPIIIWGSMTVGSTGAVSSSTAGNGRGILTIARSDVGKYTVTLSDAYSSFLYADCRVMDQTLETPATVGIYANLFSQAVSTIATPTVVFQFIALDDGAAADPASGAVVYFEIKVKNSSVP